MMPAPDSDTPLPPYTLIGPWRLLECVGGGTFGRVYKIVLAHQPGSTPKALKLARIPDDPRFAREAELLSRLHHPGVPRLHSSGVYMDGQGRSFPFLVMRFIPGTNLYDWAQRRQISSRQVLRLIAQVARALEAIHRHRPGGRRWPRRAAGLRRVLVARRPAADGFRHSSRHRALSQPSDRPLPAAALGRGGRALIVGVS